MISLRARTSPTLSPLVGFAPGPAISPSGCLEHSLWLTDKVSTIC
jgi:hypothetical protein